jgi:hypothetical protein
VIEGHGEVATSLRQAAKVGDITEHFGERDEAIENLGVAALGFFVDHASAAARYVAEDIAIVLLRNGDDDFHDRLKHDRVAFRTRGLEGHGSRDLISRFGAIDFVVGPIEEGRFDIDDGEAGDNAAAERIFETLLGRLDEFLRNGAADNGIDEFEAFARVRFEANPHIAVLAVAAGLLDVTTFGFARVPLIVSR